MTKLLHLLIILQAIEVIHVNVMNLENSVVSMHWIIRSSGAGLIFSNTQQTTIWAGMGVIKTIF